MSDGGKGNGVAVVAGSGGPLSDAIADRLRAEGFSVGRLEDGDLSHRAQTIAAAERIARELGRVSVLVTIPTLHDAAPFGEMSSTRWGRLLEAHLGATTNACAAVVPAMVRAGQGTVITISSWLALAGIAGEAYYAAATGSILAFTKSFALEVAAKGVRVNGIAVGPLEPAPTDGAYVLPGEVADTVMFLVNDAGFFVGQVLVASGGALV
jgi:NAD(P)-dependent dehydrogenase (short-subunit alcohol dehydrogenase family)